MKIEKCDRRFGSTVECTRGAKNLTLSVVHFTRMIFIYFFFIYYLQRATLRTHSIVIYGFGANAQRSRLFTKPSSYRTYPIVGLPSIFSNEFSLDHQSDSRNSIFFSREKKRVAVRNRERAFII